MRVDIVNTSGSPTGRSAELSEEVFGIEPNDHVLYLAVKHYMANQRQGTHKAKERGEIKGSTKKIKKQKGTGTARFGDIKNPLFKGGGRIFGPRPRTYSSKLNRKEKVLARNSALAYKAKESNLIVIEDFKMDSPKTKDYSEILNKLGINGKRTLLVLGEAEKNIQLSARNIDRTEVALIDDLNTYQILKANCLVIKESALEKLK